MSYENTIEIATGTIVVNKAGKVLFITGPKWKGLYTIPGGHVEYGEDIKEAAKRELKEEIGVVPERLEFINISESIFPPSFHRKAHFLFINFVGWIEDDSKISVLKKEITDYKWINPHDGLEDLSLVPSAKDLLKDYVKKYLEDRADYNVVRVGVQAMVLNDLGQILLLKRKNIFGHNTWGLPGGHLETDETIEECAVRELYEESGIKGGVGSAKVKNLGNTISSNNNRHVQIGVHIERWRGKLEIKEPHKCSAIDFFPLDKLPVPLFSSSEPLIEKFKKKVFY